MTPLDHVVRIGRVLDGLGVPWVLGGSLASSLVGEPRSTMAVDVAVALELHDVDRLVEAVQADYYVSVEMAREAVSRHSSFNLIHFATGMKVDLFPRSDDPLDVRQLAGREQVAVAPDVLVWVGAAADQVLRKLRWFDMGGRVSDRQWRDVVAILRVQAARIDRSQLLLDAGPLGLADLVARAVDEAGPIGTTDERPDVPIVGIGRGVDIDRLSHESRRVIESLFGGGGLLPEGACGAALDYFTSHALYRLVWSRIDRTFDEHSRPRTRWEDHDVLVLSWHYATDGREIQAVRISGFEFEGDLLSGFLVDGMPLSWMVRRFRSSDAAGIGWGLTWRPGGRVEFLMVDPTLRPAGDLPARVSGRAIDERRFATIDTVFGRLPPTEVAWSGRTGNWWIRHVDSPMGGLSPMAVQRVLVPGLDGAVQEFVPVEEDWVSPTEDDGAHRIMLHLVSLAHDERVLLPGEDAAVPWTLARRFTFIAVGGDEEALRELHRAVRGWLGRVGRARLEPLADDALTVRNTETGFEIEFREHEVWIAPAIAHLVHSARLVLDLYGIDQLIVSTSD